MSPKEYADNIFDKINLILENNHDYIAQARTPEEVLLNKQKGLKSIMFGIENGLAIEDDISNIAHFKKRESYISLCVITVTTQSVTVHEAAIRITA